MGSFFDGDRRMQGTMYVGAADGEHCILWFSGSYYPESAITPRFWLSRELAKAFSGHFSRDGEVSGVSIAVSRLVAKGHRCPGQFVCPQIDMLSL
jgi:hypothetical protein